MIAVFLTLFLVAAVNLPLFLAGAVAAMGYPWSSFGLVLTWLFINALMGKWSDENKREWGKVP